MRYDKYSGVTGGFRATLAADWVEADHHIARGVGLNATGLLVKGASVTGLLGVMILDKTKTKAKDRVDVMTHGECVDLPAGFDAGDIVFCDAAGVLSAVVGGTALPVGSQRVGFVTDDKRLVVRFGTE